MGPGAIPVNLATHIYDEPAESAVSEATNINAAAHCELPISLQLASFTRASVETTENAQQGIFVNGRDWMRERGHHRFRSTTQTYFSRSGALLVCFTNETQIRANGRHAPARKFAWQDEHRIGACPSSRDDKRIASEDMRDSAAFSRRSHLTSWLWRVAIPPRATATRTFQQLSQQLPMCRLDPGEFFARCVLQTRVLVWVVRESQAAPSFMYFSGRRIFLNAKDTMRFWPSFVR